MANSCKFFLFNGVPGGEIEKGGTFLDKTLYNILFRKRDNFKDKAMKY